MFYIDVQTSRICDSPFYIHSDSWVLQGWWVTTRARARAARAMVTTTRVAGDKVGKGGKAMATATRVAGEQMAMATKRAMATKTRLEGVGGGNDQPLCTT